MLKKRLSKDRSANAAVCMKPFGIFSYEYVPYIGDFTQKMRGDI